MTDRELVLIGKPFGPRLSLRRAGRDQVLSSVDLVSLSATLRLGDDLVASTGIETLNGDGLGERWQNVADSFRGWEGEKTGSPSSMMHDCRRGTTGLATSQFV